MPSPSSFIEQYNHAKSTFQRAIDNNFTVVLCGKGANGKTYLVNEFSKQLSEKRYQHIYMSEYESIDQSPYDIYDKMVIEVNNINFINQMYVSEKHNGFVVINMNKFKYPKYSRLRSGRM